MFVIHYIDKHFHLINNMGDEYGTCAVRVTRDFSQSDADENGYTFRIFSWHHNVRDPVEIVSKEEYLSRLESVRQYEDKQRAKDWIERNAFDYVGRLDDRVIERCKLTGDSIIKEFTALATLNLVHLAIAG